MGWWGPSDRHRERKLSPSVLTRIALATVGREKLQALDARVQLVADLLRARDEIVDLQQSLLLLNVDVDRHDEPVGQRFQLDSLDFRNPDLIGQIVQLP